LFVVLDVYRYATADSSPGLWDWTLGAQQYEWFRQTLERSHAKFKFVFAHHVRGYGRGGVATAKSFEWGGYENNGTTWGFTARRPGWAMPVHQLMVAHGVTIFFQGHDHLFAQELLDGIVYQEVPMPSDSTYEIGWLANADAYTGVTLRGAGHLRVTVAPELAKVEFVSAYLPRDTSANRHNGDVAFSYAVPPRNTAVEEECDRPVRARLDQNYPNPFNPSTHISYAVAKAGHVTLTVFDMLGRAIATLVDEYEQAGPHTAAFSAQDASARRVQGNLPSGIYFYQLKIDAVTITKKALLIK
jgi:hypothetical protein